MDIGKKGEIIAVDWALDANITPNPVENDETGWDLIYEFPERFDLEELTADLIPQPIQCWIQVKTTQAKDPKWQIKLTNLKRLVDTPLPAFYLEIKLDEDYNVETVHIFHVGKQIISKTYKKLRELGVDGKKRAHKKKMQLPKGGKVKISPLDGIGLKNEIEKIIGESYQDYLDKKRNIKEECGYEEAQKEVSFNFELPEDYEGNIEEYLVDFELGIIPKLEIKDYVEKDIRFGIPVEVNKEKKGELKVSSQDEKDVTVVLRTEDYREKITLESKLIFPTVTKSAINKDNLKFLVRSHNLELVVEPYKGNIRYNYSFPGNNQKVRLDELRDVSNFIWLFNKMKDVEDSLILTISYEKKKILEANLDIGGEFENNVIRRAMSVRYGIILFDYLGISLDTLFLPEDLVEQIEKIRILSKIIEPRHFEVTWSYKVESQIEKDLEGGMAAFIYPYQLQFGEINIYVIVAFRGLLEIVERKDNKYECCLISSDNIIEDYQLWEGDISEPPRSIDESVNQVKENYKEDYLIIS